MLKIKMGKKKLLGKHHGIIKYGTKLYLKDLAFSLAFPVAMWPWANYTTSLEFMFFRFPKNGLDNNLLSLSAFFFLSFSFYYL